MRICAIGDLLLDVIVRLETPLVADGDVPTTTRTGAGGQAANVAAWAATLGAEACVVCKLGDDAAAAVVRADAEALGVEVVGPAGAGRTGVVVSLVGPGPTRTMASDRGVAPELAPDDLDPAWFDGCDVLHVSGYALLREPIALAALRARELAPGRVSLDLSSAPDIAVYGPQRFRELVERLAPDLVFANEDERAVLGGLPAPEWVLKLGGRGILLSSGEELAARPAEVVDTTGAGDALAAGYLVGGPDAALDAAARCIGRMGAIP